MDHKIEFSHEALGDLIDLYDFIAERDGEERAIGFIDRIEACCNSLAAFPNRGRGATTCAPDYGFWALNVALPSHSMSGMTG